MTIRSLLEEHAQKIPDAVALRFCEDKQWRSRTFAEFLGDVGRTASAYGELFSLRPREEHVALVLSNSPTWMEVYLACSGAGVAGMRELTDEIEAGLKGEPYAPKAFAHQIAYNVIPQIGSEQYHGYTSEEMKMQNEGRKILHLPDMKVSCTCVRVPVLRSHSVSVVLRTKEKISVDRARALIAAAPGCKLVDDLPNHVYPMPLDTSDQDLIFVGRIREDLTSDNGLNLWCCGDQVRKGAATNAVQIAELLL